MKNKILKNEQKILGVMFSLSSMLFVYFLFLEIKEDYFLIFHKEKTSATLLNEIRNVSTGGYQIDFKYYNSFVDKDIQCTLNLKYGFGNEFIERKTSSFDIFYTKESSCSVYLEGNNLPKTGLYFIHVILFIISILVFLLGVKKIFSRATSTENL